MVASQVTNCHFHGPYLYTTVAAKEAAFRLQLGVQGHAYWVQPRTTAGDGAVPEVEKKP